MAATRYGTRRRNVHRARLPHFATFTLGLTACGPTGSRIAPPVPELGGDAAPSTATRGRTRTLEQDETVTMASGAKFTGSAGWTLETRPGALTLIAPEEDLRLTYVEVVVPDRADAIANAWTQVAPGLVPVEEDSIDLPPSGGWDVDHRIAYRTEPSEQREVYVVARRKGPTWFVTVIDGSSVAFPRRGVQLDNMVSSLTVEGLDSEESLAGKTAHELDAARISELDRFIDEARVIASVPGAAVAVVQDGAVVLAKGYGVRTIGAKDEVGPRTLFMTGSIGKSLTALMMARLVDEGTISWDTPVTTALPGFVIGDAATTELVTMRHTLCACTGVPHREFDFLFEWVEAEERLASMKAMAPTTGLGETFQYSDLMVMAGGFAAARARSPNEGLQPAYRGAMQSLVFEPLRMTSTTFDFERVMRSDHAAPHSRDLHGEPVAIPVDAERWTVPLGPAGAMWSNVEDMAQYVALELGKGELEGTRLVSERQLMARREPQAKISDEESYALGWEVGHRNDLHSVGHGGGTSGFQSRLEFLPEHGVGIIVLTNAAPGEEFIEAVLHRFHEILFDLPPKANGELSASLQLAADLRAIELARIAEADPAWFDPLIGTWEASGLGRIDLRRDPRGALLDAGEWTATVGKKTRRDGAYALVLTDAAHVPLVGFELVPRTRDGRTVLVAVDRQHVYVFERR